MLRVEGNEDDLRFLAADLRQSDTKIEEDPAEPGKYLLRSPDFATCSTHDDVFDLGVEFLKRMTGWLRWSRGSTAALSPGALFRLRDDGTRDVVARVVSAGFVVRWGHGTLVAWDTNGEPVAAPPTASKQLVDLMARDPAVAKVMRLSGAADADSWVGLARIREVIEADAGGVTAMQAAGWASGNELDRFKHSASSVAVAGDDARHGHERTAPPRKPMSLREAKDHVDHIRREWLRSKGVCV